MKRGAKFTPHVRRKPRPETKGPAVRDALGWDAGAMREEKGSHGWAEKNRK